MKKSRNSMKALRDQAQEIEAAAKALLSDIQEMRDKDSARRDGAWFGGFSEFQDGEVTPYRIPVVSVEWPNLAIGAARLAKALEPAPRTDDSPREGKTRPVCPQCGAPEVTDGIFSNLAPYSGLCIACLQGKIK